MSIQIEKRVHWTGREHLVVVLPYKLSWFPDATGKEISVALNTTEVEYVSLSVQSSMASQASNRFYLIMRWII